MHHDNYTSKIGEEVYLTKEDLTEMKLYGKMQWTIQVYYMDMNFSSVRFLSEQMEEIVTIIYNTTNLVYETTEPATDDFSQFFVEPWKEKIITPIMPIKVIWDTNKYWWMLLGEKYGVEHGNH